MTKVPKISVCIATYNQDKYLDDCLSSVISQVGNFELEVLVGNDCSNDKTIDILAKWQKQYPSTIKVFSYEKNIGPFHNYKFLIGKASGDYLASLDGDDFWLPGKLGKQLAFMQEKTECSAVYSNAVIVTPGNKLLGAFNIKRPERFDIKYLLKKGNFLVHSSLFYQAKFKDAILNIDGIEGETIDYSLHLTLARKGFLGYIDQVLVGYRRHTENSMMAREPDKVRAFYLNAIADFWQETELKEVLKNNISIFWMDIILKGMISIDFSYIKTWHCRICHEFPGIDSVVFLKGGGYALRRILYIILTNSWVSLTGNNLRIFYK